MADALTEEQRKLIHGKFKKLSHKGHHIERGQLIQLVQLLGQNPTKAQVQNALEACELNEADKLTLDDCEAVIWSIWYEMDVEDELKNAFSKFDTNGNGYLDVEEFKKAMLSYGEAFTDDELEEMMKLVDVNEDGQIDYNEFVQAMTDMETVNGGCQSEKS